jgi:hypothetical protein
MLQVWQHKSGQNAFGCAGEDVKKELRIRALCIDLYSDQGKLRKFLLGVDQQGTSGTPPVPRSCG